uniref:Uncharacterized protein n=1 Tax=Rhizophora mucronata TaxID=61149 RepID=A0A2P2NVL1_RHIMU
MRFFFNSRTCLTCVSVLIISS